MNLGTRLVGGLGLVVPLGLSSMAPASALDTWSYTWNGVVKFSTFHPSGTSGYYGRLYDVADDAVPVRAQYHRVNNVEYNIYNANGPGSYATSATVSSRIDWVIECNDYAFGDDCSGKYYG